jgi:hypothetical protein
MQDAFVPSLSHATDSRVETSKPDNFASPYVHSSFLHLSLLYVDWVTTAATGGVGAGTGCAAKPSARRRITLFAVAVVVVVVRRSIE